MPPQHSTEGLCFRNKADGNGGNNTIFRPARAWPGPLCQATVPAWQCQAATTYGISMLRILLMIAAAIVIVFVAAEVIHTLFWLALIALIIAVIGMSLGVFRVGRRPERRPRRRH